MSNYHCMIPSPVGELTLTSDGDALTGLSFAGGDWDPKIPDGSIADVTRFEDVITQLEEYFEGSRTSFDLELKPKGTDFQLKVWAALRTIPYGSTWSYADLARAIGQPTAFRAVGLANGKNPIAIIVPCHRVIGANGKLVGFGGGLDNKKILLDIESGSVELAL
jgi:methylated-DNA-[protein]-cysteine S-methyltransferase